MIGYRFIDRWYNNAPNVGDTLANSFDWDGDEITDAELDGTCAFSTRDAIEKYTKWSNGCGWIVKIESDDYHHGDLDDEIIMSAPIVLSVEII